MEYLVFASAAIAAARAPVYRNRIGHIDDDFDRQHGLIRGSIEVRHALMVLSSQAACSVAVPQ